MAELAGARSHHLRWLLIDLALFIATGVVAIVPGPNIFAYYMLFRVIGHRRSWWGARRGMAVVTWTFEPDPGLAELAALVDVPREHARTARGRDCRAAEPAAAVGLLRSRRRAVGVKPAIISAENR